jgi:hypothetical protein
MDLMHGTKVQNMSVGRQEAYEIFKRDYQGNHEIEDQKRFLKKSYAEAKLLGELINTTRNKMSRIITTETFVKTHRFFYTPFFRQFKGEERTSLRQDGVVSERRSAKQRIRSNQADHGKRERRV